MAIKGSGNGLGKGLSKEIRNSATVKAATRKKAVAGRGAARTPSRSGKMPSITVRKASFLAVLRDTANVSRAARESGLSSSAAYRHRARHAQFAADWDAAVAEALDELEDSLIQRAKHGVERPVFFRGAQVGAVRSYSDALGMFLLKARRPETYSRLVATPGELAEMTQEEAKAEVVRRFERLGDESGEDMSDGMSGSDDRPEGAA